MSTTLYAITNTKLNLDCKNEQAKLILEKLEQLNFETTKYYDEQGDLVQEIGGWKYCFDDNNGEHEELELYGKYSIQPSLYPHCSLIHTIYRYSLIYQNYSLEWFTQFRNELYQTVKAIGGTEIIYLPDQRSDKLCKYFGMFFDNKTYEEIKSKMIDEFKLPVTDYKLLNYEKLEYVSINEFFLDDFSDLKTT